MTEVEAVEFVVRLIATYPGAKFTQDNARAYQSLLLSLGRDESEVARVELAETNKFIPSFAEIREVVMRNRKQARAVAVLPALSVLDVRGAPEPHGWGKPLERQLDAAARHQAIAERWYAERGKRRPPDPGQVFVDIAASGARGDDVRQRFRKSVLEQEQEELERRHP